MADNADSWTINYIPAEIGSVMATKNRLMKRAEITMINGEEFVFDYGMLSVKNLVAAVEASIAGS